jgi:ABC-2 type transport system ATP-binding protein/lipopolysaccharide transport system ATP-binding protein
MKLHTVSEALPQAIGPSAHAETAIHLEGVSVRYRIPTERFNSFKEYMIRRLQRRIRHQHLWALKDVSLEVGKGEVFGLIGQNGAGKSTLLKVVAKVLRPTKGRVWVKGRIAPLLEVGAGFHAELTGRENVYLNGALLGFNQREMDQKFQQIVDFAELWDFIDAPLRTYSTGMRARLGFAVATDVEPEILIIDEVLAVGDEAFRRKSSKRIQTFHDMGATILIVSHNLDIIQSMCHRAAWLDHGEIRKVSEAGEVVEAYQGSLPS